VSHAVTAQDPDGEARRRRTVLLALAHAALAVGFLVAFVWVQIHR